MNCREFFEKIVLRVRRGEPSGPTYHGLTEDALAREHLGRCPECRAEFELLTRLDAAARADLSEAVSDADLQRMWDKIYVRISSEQQGRSLADSDVRTSRPLAGLLNPIGPAYAVILFVLLLGAAVFLIVWGDHQQSRTILAEIDRLSAEQMLQPDVNPFVASAKSLGRGVKEPIGFGDEMEHARNPFKF